MTTAGLICGFQAGVWNLYRTVRRVDPDGSKVDEAKAIIAEARNARLSSAQQKCNSHFGPAPSAPPAEDKTGESKPRTNRYGDIIEEDTFK